MTELRIGHLVIVGNDRDLAMGRRTYDGQLPAKPLQDYLPRDYRVEYHTAAEFLARGAIIPGTENTRRKSSANPRGGKAAYGFAFPRALWINSSRPAEEQVYVGRHEPTHPIVAAFLTRTKAAQIRALIERVAGKNLAYRNRLSEVLCDTAVELFWGRGSILDDYYGDIPDADMQKAWDILVAPPPTHEPPVADPPDPVDVTPVPLPLPDPALVAAQGRIAELEDRIAAKDAKMQEGLLL